MSAMRVIWLMLILIPFVLLVDLIWLGIIMKSFYAQEIGTLMRRNGELLVPRWSAAALVYLLIPGGLILFVRPMLGATAPLSLAFGWGALFGLVLYGVYDMTNLAVLEKWTWRVALADMAWGGVLCGLSAVVLHTADRWLGK